MGLTNKMHRFIENSNKKVLTRAMYSCQFHACLVFFFKFTLRFRLFIADLRTTEGLVCAIFKRRLSLAILRLPVIFGYIRVDDHLVKQDPTWTIRMKHQQVYRK